MRHITDERDVKAIKFVSSILDKKARQRVFHYIYLAGMKAEGTNGKALFQAHLFSTVIEMPGYYEVVKLNKKEAFLNPATAGDEIIRPDIESVLDAEFKSTEGCDPVYLSCDDMTVFYSSIVRTIDESVNLDINYVSLLLKADDLWTLKLPAEPYAAYLFASPVPTWDDANFRALIMPRTK